MFSWVRTILFVILIASSSQRAWGEAFDRAKEFPNLFLGERVRSLALQESRTPAEQNELDTEVENSTKLVNAALLRMFENTTIKVALPPQYEAEEVRIFDLLKKKTSEGEPDGQIMPSGGVVRSYLGSIYQQLYEAYQKDPHFEPHKILSGIAQDKTDAPITKYSGVGSDIDLFTKGFKNVKKAQVEIRGILNSVRERNKVAFSRDGISRLAFPLGDVADYDEHTKEATQQGGSVLDFLAFDMNRGKLLSPPRFPGAVSDIIRGKLEYASPLAGASIDRAAQSIRAIRPLYEIPYLQLDPESKARLVDDLSGALQTNLSDKAKRQVEAAIRNARFEGAHNAAFRSGAQEPEGLFLQLSQKTENPLRMFGERYLIPEGGRALNGFPENQLMPESEFMKVTGGYIYHGTPDVKNTLPVIRNGFYVSSSDEGQGRSSSGRGTYAGTEALAQMHAQNGGFVFKLEINKERPLNILRGTGQEIPEYAREARKEKRNYYEYIGDKYGIDLIYYGDGKNLREVVILNANAVKRSDVSEALIFKAQGDQIIEGIEKAWTREAVIDWVAQMKLLFETSSEVEPANRASLLPRMLRALIQNRTVRPQDFDDALKGWPLLADKQMLLKNSAVATDDFQVQKLAKALGLTDEEVNLVSNANNEKVGDWQRDMRHLTSKLKYATSEADDLIERVSFVATLRSPDIFQQENIDETLEKVARALKGLSLSGDEQLNQLMRENKQALRRSPRFRTLVAEHVNEVLRFDSTAKSFVDKTGYQFNDQEVDTVIAKIAEVDARPRFNGGNKSTHGYVDALMSAGWHSPKARALVVDRLIQSSGTWETSIEKLERLSQAIDEQDPVDQEARALVEAMMKDQNAYKKSNYDRKHVFEIRSKMIKLKELIEAQNTASCLGQNIRQEVLSPP